MRRRRFDHLDLRVNDPAAAQRFYARFLPAVGFTINSSDQEWCIWQAPGRGPVEFFGFTEEPKHQPNDNLIAFWAENQVEVDRIADVCQASGRPESGRPGAPAGIFARLLCRFFRGPEREQARSLLPAKADRLRSWGVLRDISR